MERAQHLDGGDVRAGIVDDALGAVLDEVFEQLKSLVDLSPLLGLFFHELRVDAWHYLVEVLAVGSERLALEVR